MGIFDVPRMEKLPTHLNRSFSNIRYGKRKMEQREYEEIRASNFPLCPRAYVIYRRSPTNRRPHFEQKFVSETATHLGTALHLVLQKWFGIEGFMHGNWVCVRCRVMEKNHTGTPRCKQCGREMLYHEYAITPSPQTPFSGHIDGILVDDMNYLIDFKGSSVPAIRDLKNARQPKESHYLQTNAYAHAVNLDYQRFGLTAKIQKIIIIYVDRGQPWKTWLPMQVPLSTPVYRETIGRVQLAQECLKTGKIPRGLCVSPSDEYARWCPWQTTCFSPAIDGLLSDTVQPESRLQKESEQDLYSLASFLESH